MAINRPSLVLWNSRAPTPSVQYASPRPDIPSGCRLISGTSGENTQIVSPVAASIAAAWCTPVLVYSTPSTISGVTFKLPSGPPESGSAFQRHATRSSATLSALIWSSAAYRVEPASPPQYGHSPPGAPVWAWACAVANSTAASAAILKWIMKPNDSDRAWPA